MFNFVRKKKEIINNQQRLAGKVAIVTGASGNIGEAIALALAQDGADVVVHYGYNRQKAEAIVESIKQMDRKSLAYQADIRNYQEVETLISSVHNEFGRIDILVNNAGICRDKLMIMMTTQDWDDVIGVNLTGTFNFCKAAVPYMTGAGEGRIINISSITGLVAQKMRTNYGASKRAVIGLTKCLARELASKGILVNAIAPQVVEGGLSRSAAPQELKILKMMTPAGRLGVRDDVAGAVVFLASRDSRYMVGAVINLTGGLITWQI